MLLKKTVSIILALIMMSAFVACVGNNNAETTPETTVEPAPEKPTELIVIGSGDEDYTVIRSQYATDIVLDSVRSLTKCIKDKYSDSWTGKVLEDWEAGVTKDSIIDNDNREILVGNTNRRETQDILAELGDEEYIIRAVGKKIVIVGKDDYATIQAVNKFIDDIIKPFDDKATLKISAELSLKEKASLRKAPINSEAKYRIMSWNLLCDGGVAEDALEICLFYLPDIFSMQESNKAVHTKVYANLPKYYKYADKFHSNGSTYVYTPIIYNSNILELKESDVEWLRGRYTGTNTKSVAWAIFEGKDDKELFAVINFHGAVCSTSYKGFENYTSAQLNEQSQIWRTDNVKQVLEIKERIVAKYGNIPIMVNGDCNFTKTSTQYKQLTDAGFAEAELTARLKRTEGQKSCSTYGTVPGAGNSIDHVFGINGIDFVTHLIPKNTTVHSASDHCPVIVDFNPTKK